MKYDKETDININYEDINKHAVQFQNLEKDITQFIQVSGKPDFSLWISEVDTNRTTEGRSNGEEMYLLRAYQDSDWFITNVIKKQESNYSQLTRT